MQKLQDAKHAWIMHCMHSCRTLTSLTSRDAALQGFNWDSHAKRDSHRQPGWLQQLGGHAAELAECGVTAVWLPPPCHSIAEQGYMPQDLDRCCRHPVTYTTHTRNARVDNKRHESATRV